MLLSVDKLSKNFGAENIFSNVSAQIQEKDRIGLIGTNGVGKTTLIKTIIKEIPSDDGSVSFDKSIRIGYQKQNAGLMFTGTIWDELCSVFSKVFEIENEMQKLAQKKSFGDDAADLEKYTNLENQYNALDGYHAVTKIKTVLTGMGFLEHGYDKKIENLSGGEQTRLAIAKLLLEEPNLLILDEPTNHLDLVTMTWLESYLADYRGAILVVSHDRYFLDKICTRIWELEDGIFHQYPGNYSRYLILRNQNIEREDKLIAQQKAEMEKLEDYVNRNLVRASTTKMAQSRRTKLEKMEVIAPVYHRSKPPKISLTYDREPVKDILKVDDLTLGIDEANKTLLKNVSFTIRRGEKIAIIGKNGAGKTTLLKYLMNCLSNEDNAVSWGNGIKVGYYEQGSDHLDPNITVLETVWKYYPSLYETYIRNHLGALGLSGDEPNKLVGELSGGERARLKLTLICLSNSNVLLMDEPTNHLDVNSKEILQNALQQYTGTLIIVSHDRFLLNEVPTKIFYIEDQTIQIFNGSYDAYLEAWNNKDKSAQHVEEKDKIGKTIYNKGKESRKKNALLRKEYSEINALIEQTELEIKELEETINDENNSIQFELLQELCQLLGEKHTLLDGYMEQWLLLSDEIEKMNEEK